MSERDERRVSLNEAASAAMQACVEYAAVGDALGYPGQRGRERLLDAVTELWRWSGRTVSTGPRAADDTGDD